MASTPPPSGFENGPYNLLSLDGGGIRGVSELVVLHRIMTRIQERGGLDELPKPCDYFHLIGGTSTGGLIAIMLGRLRLSTSEALTEYDLFARRIFRKKNRKVSISSKFRDKALQGSISEVVQKYADSDLMKDPSGTPWSGKAFVCAKPSKNQDQGARRIRAYPSDDDWDKDCKIWEAARATSAAPLFFKPISITSGGVTEDFIDAALGCNNPTAEVLDEAGEILDGSCKLGCVLSLGAGTRPKKLESSRGLVRNVQVLKLLKDYTTDSERTHVETKKRFTDFPSTYFRFSVPDAAAKIGMAKYKKIGELKRMTEEYLDSTAAAEIEKVVDILCGGTTENVTVGHVRYPNKEQIIMDTRRAQAGGIASRLFTGRGDVLNMMSAFFTMRENNIGPRREFLLYGMGGVGKTQIALKFKQMMETEKRFKRVLWIDATDSTTIEECYSEIASGLPADETDGTGTRKVLHWFDTTSEEWLLIMDNRGDDDRETTRFLPTADKGNIVYTTRHDHLRQHLPQGATSEVNKMEEHEAVTLLLRAIHESTISPQLREMSLPVVRELGCLPLAIDQAGAYMFMDECPLGDYLRIFKKQKQAMLKKPRYKGSSEHNLPVYTTFDMSQKVLMGYAKGKRGLATAETAKMAIKILSFTCFYQNEGIMEDMVKRAAEQRFSRVQDQKREAEEMDKEMEAGEIKAEGMRLGWTQSMKIDRKKRQTGKPLLPRVFPFGEGKQFKKTKRNNRRPDQPPPVVIPLGEGKYCLEDVVRVRAEQNGEWDPELFRDAVRLLESLSIVKRHRSRTISIHLLIHSWARDRMSDAERASFSHSARVLLYDSISFAYEPDDQLFRRRLVPHLKACEDLVPSRGPENFENIFLARRAQTAEDAGRLGEAIGLWEDMIRERKFLKDDGPDSECVAHFSLELARAYSAAGWWLQCEALLTELLDRTSYLIREKDRLGHQKKNQLNLLIKIHSALAKLYVFIGYASESAKHFRTVVSLMQEEGSSEIAAIVPDMEDLYMQSQHMVDNGHFAPDDSPDEDDGLPESILWERYEEALHVQGPYGEKTLWALYKLTTEMVQQKRASCACILADAIIARCREHYGPSHAMIGRALRLLAKACFMTGLVQLAQEIQEENIELHLTNFGPESFHTKSQVEFLELLVGWTNLATKLCRDLGLSRAALPKALKRLVVIYKETDLRSCVCEGLSCGQTRHCELIARLGVEDRWPEGFLVTLDDIGAHELGITEEDLIAESGSRTREIM